MPAPERDPRGAEALQARLPAREPRRAGEHGRTPRQCPSAAPPPAPAGLPQRPRRRRAEGPMRAPLLPPAPAVLWLLLLGSGEDIPVAPSSGKSCRPLNFAATSQKYTNKSALAPPALRRVGDPGGSLPNLCKEEQGRQVSPAFRARKRVQETPLTFYSSPAEGDLRDPVI